jgi:hypothetical protein
MAKFLAWWATSRKWIVGIGVAALLLRLVMAGYSHHHVNQVSEQNRFVPTPTVNVLLDQKTLKECWAGNIEYTIPKNVEQEFLAATETIRTTKLDTREMQAALERFETARERSQYYVDHPNEGTKILFRNLPYCSDLRAGISQ